MSKYPILPCHYRYLSVIRPHPLWLSYSLSFITNFTSYADFQHEQTAGMYYYLRQSVFDVEECQPGLLSMEWYPSLFLKFFHQLIFPCRHTCSLETLGYISTCFCGKRCYFPYMLALCSGKRLCIQDIHPVPVLCILSAVAFKDHPELVRLCQWAHGFMQHFTASTSQGTLTHASVHVWIWLYP